MATILLKKTSNNARIPKMATDGSACFDLSTCDDVMKTNGETVKVRTGLAMEIPTGYHVEIYPRSGIASRGVIIPNSPCIIDSDYRGEVIITMYGLFVNKLEQFGEGSRVAQARLVRNEPTKFAVVSQLSDTVRGTGGFGSTGIK